LFTELCLWRNIRSRSTHDDLRLEFVRHTVTTFVWSGNVKRRQWVSDLSSRIISDGDKMLKNAEKGG